MVDGVFPVQQDLRDGDKGIAVLEELFQDARQSLWSVLGSVVEQDDGPGLDLFGDPFGDLRGGEVLPVQAVHVPHRFKVVDRGAK